MEFFKRNVNLMDFALKVLAIIALASFIICSVSWLMERPNRYQLVLGEGNLIRLDTRSGRAYTLFPTITAAGNVEYVTPSIISLRKKFKEAGLSDEKIENSIY